MIKITKDVLDNLPAVVRAQWNDCKKFEEELKKQDEEEYKQFARTHNTLSVGEFAVRYYLETHKILSDERLNEYKRMHGTNTYGNAVTERVMKSIKRDELPAMPEKKETKDLFDTTGVDKMAFEIDCIDVGPVDLKDYIGNIDDKIADADEIKKDVENKFNPFTDVGPVLQTMKPCELKNRIDEFTDVYCKICLEHNESWFKLEEVMSELYGDENREHNYKFNQEIFQSMSHMKVVKIRKNKDLDITYAQVIMHNGLIKEMIRKSIIRVACLSKEFSNEFTDQDIIESLSTLNLTKVSEFAKEIKTRQANATSIFHRLGLNLKARKELMKQ